MSGFDSYGNQRMMAEQIAFQVKVYLHSLANVLVKYVSNEESKEIISEIISYGDEHGWFDVRKISKQILKEHFEESVVNEIMRDAEREFKKAWAPMRKNAILGLLFIFGGLLLGGFFILSDTLGSLGIVSILLGMVLGVYFIVRGRSEIHQQFDDL